MHTQPELPTEPHTPTMDDCFLYLALISVFYKAVNFIMIVTFKKTPLNKVKEWSTVLCLYILGGCLSSKAFKRKP